ncbi:hypothetical protein DIPPA_57914 [Diplonema papillatum]|nr:hypothetical protein DIPPA_57914 [Diplonema papillatum]
MKAIFAGKKKKCNAPASSGKNTQKSGKVRDNEFYCSECAVECQNKGGFDEHVKGKKHLRKVAERAVIEESRRAAAEVLQVPNVMEAKSSMAGWIQKSAKQRDDRTKVRFEQRWVEIKGSYLTYALEKGMSEKGVLNLAGLSVLRTSTVPLNYCDVSALRSDDDESNTAFFQCEGLSHCTTDDDQHESDLNLEQTDASNVESETQSAPDNTLELSGFASGRVMHLAFDSEDTLVEWRKSILNGIEMANSVEQTELKLDQSAAVLYDKPDSSDVSKLSELAQVYRKPSLDDFELVTVIGRGSFGKVLKVIRHSTKVTYAMKVLGKEAVLKDSIVEKVRGERQSLAEVHHPFLSSLQFAFQTREKLYLIMPFYAGGDLRFHLRSRGTFPDPMARFYAAQMVLALDHLHNKDILYRDLKPANIVLDREGYAVLTDFGMAKRTRTRRSNSFCGTDTYMAPEIVAEKDYGVGVDWWSLGACLFEFLTGAPPFAAETAAELYDKITDQAVKYPKGLSSQQLSILNKFLDKNEETRLSDGPSIKAHAFFREVDFDSLLARKLEAPFQPNLAKSDTRYFDQRYTQEKAAITKSRPVPKSKDEGFCGFSYPRLSCS